MTVAIKITVLNELIGTSVRQRTALSRNKVLSLILGAKLGTGHILNDLGNRWMRETEHLRTGQLGVDLLAGQLGAHL